jgi:phage terminase large subunit-like protein
MQPQEQFDWGDDEQSSLFATVARQIQRAIGDNHIKLMPHQRPPDGDWLGWLLLAGRGAGKTQACSKYVCDHVAGPPCLPGPVPHWGAIIAPTLGDAATACYSGPSGIRQLNPEAAMSQKVGGLLVTWPNGSQFKMYGARDPDDIERLRAGGNTCLVWMEEMAAWRYLAEAWDQMRFGLRIGPHPRWIGSTTPKPRELIKKLHAGDFPGVAVTHATMYDNPHLPDHIKQALLEAYEGTAVGSQELMGRLVDQDENALWLRENIEANRLPVAPSLSRSSVVGVDPSGGSGEQGIVVVGAGHTMNEETKRVEKHGYVLADETVRTSPEGWSRKAVQTAIDWDAGAIIVETNFGGDMAVSTLQTAAEHEGVAIPIKTVHASRGKKPRAQPVSAMSVQGRWHMVGHFEDLEDQMCTWTEDSNWSPDRLDASVWPAWFLKLVSTSYRAVGSFGGSAMARQIVGRRHS